MTAEQYTFEQLSEKAKDMARVTHIFGLQSKASQYSAKATLAKLSGVYSNHKLETYLNKERLVLNNIEHYQNGDWSLDEHIATSFWQFKFDADGNLQWSV